MAVPLRIALLIETSRMSGRDMFRGIAEYSRRFGPWMFYFEERALTALLPQTLRRWSPDGILVRLSGKQLIRQVRKLRIPTVDLDHEYEVKGIPGVAGDPTLIVHQAVEHFRERGFQNFAYYGFAEVLWSELREACFTGELKRQGIIPHVFRHRALERGGELAAHESQASQYDKALVKWLHGLPKPVALMACNDMCAYQVLNVCNTDRIAVPEEVAVLGVDNDSILCEICTPPLSSIDGNAAKVGYEAAALLHRMIQGEPPPKRRIFIPPLGVVPRRSTDVLAIQDPDVAEAIHYVRGHALERLQYAKILRDLSLSRNTLESWFRRYLGHSVTREIHLTRIKRIQELLLTTNQSLEAISRQCGFEYVKSMFRIFKKQVGLTPGEYRRREKVF
jgi:LacI family transcriptional regulator